MGRLQSVCIVLLSALGPIFCSNSTDELKSLPGLDTQPEFRQFSGFLNASQTKHLFYWFIEAQQNASAKPLLLWLNGGPGCSSLQGALMEIGPYQLGPNGTNFIKNEYSWNKFANLLFIESPVNVGFSYSTDNSSTLDDNITAIENVNALRHFFEKYPEMKGHDMYIMGESYAGIYIPTTAALLMRNEGDFNLKAIAMGNAVVRHGWDSLFAPFYAHANGLLDIAEFKKFIAKCCTGKTPDTCIPSNDCTCTANALTMHIGGVDPYDISGHCFTFLDPGFNANTTDVSCFNDIVFEDYMNRQDVRQALHVPHNKTWKVCTDLTSDKKRYNELTFITMKPFVEELLKKNVRVLYFYGDTDMVCNHLTGEYFCADLGGKPTNQSSIWFLDGQVGGRRTVYENGLVYTTIRGAGHMAPQWKAHLTDHVIRRFMNNTDF